MAKTRSKVHLPIPRWAGITYLCFCIVMIPWTIYLSQDLPRHHLSPHWDLIWVGLDICITTALALTAIFSIFKSRWVVISATAAGTILFIDAWFDVLSSHRGIELIQAVMLALFIELPIAFMSFVLAFRVLDKNI